MRITKHFTKKELECPCCGELLLNNILLEMIENARVDSGIPWIITSGYRCPVHNAKVSTFKPKRMSPHVKGLAVDVWADTNAKRYKIIKSAIICAGFRRVGIGKNFIHLDIAESPGYARDRIWLYK